MASRGIPEVRFHFLLGDYAYELRRRQAVGGELTHTGRGNALSQMEAACIAYPIIWSQRNFQEGGGRARPELVSTIMH